MNPLRKLTIAVFLLFLCLKINAQSEFSKWYFGNQAGLDFSSSPPTALLNGTMVAPEGCVSISDAAGNLLFYTNGITIYNNSHLIMANGSGLFGNTSSSQSSLIVKQPGSNSKYYVFTLDVPVPTSTNGACYSIVDMNLAAGQGSVIIKNSPIYATTSEKQVAVRHCNGKDVWIISHEWNSNNFRAYLLSSSGLNLNPVISSIGKVFNGPAGAATGQLKISPDGKKLAMSTFISSTSTGTDVAGFHLLDFDASSGAVSNSLTLQSVFYAYGIEFSPDGTKLYGSLWGAVTNGLYQWNICAPTQSAIIASQFQLNTQSIPLSSMQRAIDDKIYISSGAQQSLHVINNPNGTGTAMSFTPNAISISPNSCGAGLPNYINSYLKSTPNLFNNIINCQSVTFALPSVPSFSSGCSSTPYPPGGYLWDFGEPASGAANSSTLANPVHTYSTLGTYTVSLILFNTCVNDTLKKVVTINTTGPNPSVAGTFTICKGDRHTYTVSGGSSYLWSNNSTATAVPLNPTQTTVYSVASTSNGCTLSKNFTVTVNACLGINNAGFDYTQPNIKIYPNPVKNDLFVESETAAQLYIFDNTGTLILEVKLNAGQNTINTIDLPAGFYNLKAQGKAGNWHGRVVKVE